MGRAVNKRELSETIGVSERTLTEWQKDGMPVVEFGESRGEPNTYDTEAVIRWWIEREVSRRADKSTFDRLNEIKAKREELGYRRDLGEIVMREEIRPAFRRYAHDTLATLISLPDKYAQMLELTAGIDGKHQVLQDMIGEIRDVLGNYTFVERAAGGSHRALGGAADDELSGTATRGGDTRATEPAEDLAGAVG